MEFAIAGVAILPLIIGLVEFSKQLGVHGKASQVLAMVFGVLFGGVFYAIEQSVMPDAVLPYIGIAVFGLAMGLAASGIYDFSKRFQ